MNDFYFRPALHSIPFLLITGGITWRHDVTSSHSRSNNNNNVVPLKLLKPLNLYALYFHTFTFHTCILAHFHTCVSIYQQSFTFFILIRSNFGTLKYGNLLANIQLTIFHSKTSLVLTFVYYNCTLLYLYTCILTKFHSFYINGFKFQYF